MGYSDRSETSHFLTTPTRNTHSNTSAATPQVAVVFSGNNFFQSARDTMAYGDLRPNSETNKPQVVGGYRTKPAVRDLSYLVSKRPRLCENYFPNLNVVFHDFFMTVSV